MSDFVGAFWLEFAFRTFTYGGITFTFYDVFCAGVFLSIVGIFLEHLIGDFLSLKIRG